MTTQDKLIETTITHFSDYGYQGMSMRKVASDVGIKPASIYHFFKNKQDLVENAMQVILDNHFNMVKSTYQTYHSDNLKTLFSELLNNLTSHHTNRVEETKAYVRMVSSSVPELKQLVQKHFEIYENWLIQNLSENIKNRYPHFNQTAVRELIDYHIFIANGLFWGIVIYDQPTIKRNLEQAKFLMEEYIEYHLEENHG